MDIHSEIGNKYVEYIKFACVSKQGTAFQFHTGNSWIGPQCSRVPRPFPDYDKVPLYKYKHVSQTDLTINDVPRAVDDFQPDFN